MPEILFIMADTLSTINPVLGNMIYSILVSLSIF